MGTDIHGVFQRHNQTNGLWESLYDTPKSILEVNYTLFAVLAGVRCNYSSLQSISMPRGLPSDFKPTDGPYIHNEPELDPEDDAGRFFIGDHSFSWLNSDEMLHWYVNYPAVFKTGFLTVEQYKAWDKVSSAIDVFLSIQVAMPHDCVCVVDEPYLNVNELPSSVEYIQCVWEVSDKKRIKPFFDQVALYHQQYGTVRFVFGFDS